MELLVCMEILKGDIVKIENKNGYELGKGITYYDCNELKKLKVKKPQT